MFDDTEFGPFGDPPLSRVIVRTPAGDEFVVASVHRPSMRPGFRSFRRGDVRGLERAVGARRRAMSDLASARSTRSAGCRRSSPGISTRPPTARCSTRSGSRHPLSARNRRVGGTRTPGPHRLPGIAIDHVLASPEWAFTGYWVGPDLGSDHRPVIAEVVLRGRPRTPPPPGGKRPGRRQDTAAGFLDGFQRPGRLDQRGSGGLSRRPPPVGPRRPSSTYYRGRPAGASREDGRRPRVGVAPSAARRPRTDTTGPGVRVASDQKQAISRPLNETRRSVPRRDDRLGTPFVRQPVSLRTPVERDSTGACCEAVRGGGRGLACETPSPRFEAASCPGCLSLYPGVTFATRTVRAVGASSTSPGTPTS